MEGVWSVVIFVFSMLREVGRVLLCVRPRTFGCVAICSAVLFILRSRLLLYSAGSGVNRVQVVLY